ncbi:MAG: hypothetical protein H6579_01345 [Chitinophagales bacterium]|nr:hypothetical protein [Chitinophagales bacterium]
MRNNNQVLGWFFFDVFMVILALVNINLIILDFTFSYHLGAQFYYFLFPKLAFWYEFTIHNNFIWIDLSFVAFFALEFVLRWILAVYNKEFEKWFFFPFARWYDLLGLIPIGSMRFLRVLRIGSILFRLQKMGVIDLKQSSFYPFLNKYYKVFVEEVSDRVVLNVLDGVNDEMQNGEDFTKAILTKVVRPNSDRILEYSMNKVQVVTQQIIQNHEEDIKAYLFDKVNLALAQNSEMKLIKAVPGLGGIIREQLDHAIADISYKVIAGIVEDVAKGEDIFSKEIKGISESVLDALEEDQELEEILKIVSSQTIDIVKEQVSKQKWKEN